METLIPQICQLLNHTLSPDNTVISSATEALDHLSLLPDFPYALIAIATGGENQGQKIASATYLKNFIRRHIDSSKASSDFRNRLVQALLQSEPAVLKILVEAFRVIIVKDFVKENSWPELVPELRSVIQNSNFVCQGANSQWNTINAFIVLQTITKPFQYFLNPSQAKEPVPPQLELIVKEILVPLLALFHHLVEKVLSAPGRTEMEIERILLIICKCIYFSVRSHMPADLVPLLPSLCLDIFLILDSLSFNGSTSEDGYLLRMKTGKRSLQIFCALVTRHRQHSDKLMPNIINCVSKIVMQSTNISKLDFLSERIIALAFDVLLHVLGTGPGWRFVSPHFSSLLDSAIFPALVMNQKDISEWEEDPDEYIRKNLPSDLFIQKFMDGDFTARKSAINLLGVISMAKGPPMMTSSNSSSASIKRKKGDKSMGKEQSCLVGELLVLPFLSKFPVPSGTSAHQTNNYYGVLMAYGGLQDFLRERNPFYTATLVRTRVLPVYSLSPCVPYLVANANWVLGELALCLPEEMSADIYASLLKALIMPDVEDISCYPVRASAAGAIAELLENDYLPPEWLPLLQVVVSKTDNEDDNESSILFELLRTVVEAGNENVAAHIPYIVTSLVDTISKHIPPLPEPWPQVVERGFAALAVIAQSWEDSCPEETEQNESSEEWRSGRAAIARAFSILLQQAWLKPVQLMEGEISSLPPSSCIGDSSKLLWFIVRSVDKSDAVSDLKISELLMVWADVIADWHAWEELEDLSIFECISEVVNLHKRCELRNFIVGKVPSPPAPPVHESSIIEGIGAFVHGAISEYPSATWRVCSCVHSLLHVPTFSFEAEGVKQSLVIASSQAAFSRFKEIQSKPSPMWKPLLLLISSCYLCYPDLVERILEKVVDKGFNVWASVLVYISSSSFEPRLSAESEIKLIVMTLVKVVERLLGCTGAPNSGLLQDCFVSLMEAFLRLKQLQKEEENEDDGAEYDDDDDDDEGDADEETEDDEDSEDYVREETEEEFMERYAMLALNLEKKMVVEEDFEYQEDLELDDFGEVDEQSAVLSLIERYHQVLVRGNTLPPHLVTGRDSVGTKDSCFPGLFGCQESLETCFPGKQVFQQIPVLESHLLP
ncbi:Importin-beta [Macleaya cordata]|uniref:Importin-beta n=1 Tax=Macleaya cordata TaxID=56857 RepID=A0A200R1X7_MACCD|nr:Importin-beta [Macleaya cordata]